MSGRFAQARGSSAWARAFNANLTQQRNGFVQSMTNGNRLFLNSSNIRMMASVAGESPLTGFAEQYRSVTHSFTTLGQSASTSDSVAGDADAQVVAGSTVDELEFVQIAEVPTLFTYNHENSRCF
jgi:hypothetical protein